MTRGRKTAVATPDRYEELKKAADELLSEIGFYVLRVRAVTGEMGPSTEGLDHRSDAVARIIYREDAA